MPLLLLACQAVTGVLTRAVWDSQPDGTALQLELTPTGSPSPSARLVPSPVPGTILPTVAVDALAAPAATPPEAALALPPDVDFQVRLHPDGPLYAGDQVSLEVIAPPEVKPRGLKAQVWLGKPQQEALGEPQGEALGQADFERFGIAGRYQATLYWVVDTSGLPAGDYPVTISVQPAGFTFTETLTLLPAAELPPPEPGAHWAAAAIDCCVLHYITGSSAERDLERLEQMAADQALSVSQKMGAEFAERVSIVLLPRVLGHGGFTTQDISLAYLDRNYAGSTTQMVLHHELVHVLDMQLGGDLRPTLLLEGLAVYLSGGHFKPEPLMPRATALLDLGWYIPLRSLIDDFYPAQHEIGYLQAGALVEYLVERWGWSAVSAFYRDIHPVSENGSQSQAIDKALRVHFDISLSALEDQFKQALRAERVTDELRQDVRLTVKQYDLIRSYQQLLDPSAYFMTAWLPDSKESRQRGIVADYLRRPLEIENLTIETLLVNADTALRRGKYAEAEQILQSVEAVLFAIQSGAALPLDASPLAREHAAVIAVLLDQGCEPQRLAIEKYTARAWCALRKATTSGLDLQELDLVRSGESWTLPEKLNY